MIFKYSEIPLVYDSDLQKECRDRRYIPIRNDYSQDPHTFLSNLESHILSNNILEARLDQLRSFVELNKVSYPMYQNLSEQIQREIRLVRNTKIKRIDRLRDFYDLVKDVRFVVERMIERA